MHFVNKPYLNGEVFLRRSHLPILRQWLRLCWTETERHRWSASSYNLPLPTNLLVHIEVLTW